MSPNDADGMANSVDPDQTAPLGAVWSGSALFAQAYLSENLGSLRYFFYLCYLFTADSIWVYDKYDKYERISTLCLLPYFICANSEGSGETARMQDAQTRPEPSMVAYVINTIISRAGSF